ncbi:MAG: crotonase/enoyl-CoA hydratase family protein [Betaproteobacteria bacterium]|nr:crotonase/enoyl-CoA hydratase family protein [Betaproteobacteria bacterium]MCC6249402.1 crotonase/enoyl-CoA hydratase family protein [Rubrivivax sp.]
MSPTNDPAPLSPEAARFTTLRVERQPGEPRIARITLNRPERLNAINQLVPEEIRRAVAIAEADDDVHVIVLAGAGRAFCAGYDLQDFGSGRAEHPCQQEKHPWEPTADYAEMKRYTEDFMSLWRCRKPTIAMVHGVALAGGSDIAMCCDLLVMADDAKIGYPPVRVWGCPTTAMWTYRLGPMRAKQLMFTGDMIDGQRAAEWGLATMSAPAAQLEAATLALARRIAGVPRPHLTMHKMVVNQAMLTMGLEQTQMLATLFDGITRHNPEGLWFRRQAQAHGFKSAVEWRDSGRAIPEGDEARALIAELEKKLAGQ